MTKMKECPVCGGEGFVVSEERLQARWAPRIDSTCTACSGTGEVPRTDESTMRKALDVIEQAGAAVDDKLAFQATTNNTFPERFASKSEQKRLAVQRPDALFPEAPRPWTVKKITGYTDGRSKKRTEFTRGYDVFDAQDNPVARFYDKSDAETVCKLVNHAEDPDVLV